MSRTFHFSREQTYGCEMCGKCCGRYWPVPVSPEERTRLSGLAVPDALLPAGQWFKNGYIAKKEHRCIFFDGKLCMIHKQYGLKVKALACRLYPLDIHAWEDGSVSASLRYDCPAVAKGTENNLAPAIADIQDMADEIARYLVDKTPVYSAKLKPEMKRLREIAETYAQILTRAHYTGEERLLAAALLLKFHAQPENMHDIPEAEDFCEDALALMDRSKEELADTLNAKREPTKDQLSGLRFLTVSFLRDDNGMNLSDRFSRMKQNIAFVAGRAKITLADGPEIGPDELFPRLKCESGAAEPFFRWLTGRVRSMHFCGGAAFGLTFEQGMILLLSAWPAAAGLASVFAKRRGSTQIQRRDFSDAMIRLDYSFMRTKLYRSKNLLAVSRRIVFSDEFPALIQGQSQPLK